MHVSPKNAVDAIEPFRDKGTTKTLLRNGYVAHVDSARILNA